MSERADVLVIGAGVVGLAVARRLAQMGREPIVLEKNAAYGEESSARNSEVIHAGIYYPKDSLKARLCLAGKKFLYRYLEERGIEHRRCGKLIVASEPDQVDKLDLIAAKARANGVEVIERYSAADALALEPQLRVEAALWSPTTGVLDSHGLMIAYLGDLEDAGGALALETPVTTLDRSGPRPIVTTGGAAPMTLDANLVVNCAGHGAPALAVAKALDAWMCKGSYFSLNGAQPFKRLVYPIPNEAGLGVHATIDLAGRCRFGPDVEWIEKGAEPDLAVDPARAESFYDAIRAYWPGLEDGALAPDYAGFRPKIVGPGAAAADFRIDPPQDGVIDLFGIESPGLTASPAIADLVAEMAA